MLARSSVSFIDDRGKQLLKKMHDNGATLVSCSLMSKCLIAEICDEDSGDSDREQ